MRELLDMSSQRMIKLLETLVIQDEWITISELATAIGASERTVSEDILHLRKRWNQYLNIEVSFKKGVRMHHQNTAMLGRVFMDIFNDSLAVRWLDELFLHPRNTMEFYQERLFSSRSTLKRLLPKMNSYLRIRGIHIRHENNQFEIVAENEQYLRQLYTSFALELQGMNLNGNNAVLDLSVVGAIVHNIISHGLSPAEAAFILKDDIAQIYLTMFYTVSLIRENQGYGVDAEYPLEDDITPKQLEYLQSIFPKITLQKLKPIHHFIISKYNGWESAEEEALVTKEAAAFLQRVLRHIPMSFSSKTLEELQWVIKNLYLTQKYRPYSTSVLFDRIRYFSLLAEKNNLHLYRLVESELTVLSQKIHFDISPRLHDLLFWMCLSCPALASFSETQTALVISDLGWRHTHFLAEYISNAVNTSSSTRLHITEACYPQILTSKNIAPYDVIITTIPNLPLAHQKIILINDFPRYENLYELLNPHAPLPWR